jgi:predicted aminopeptidase
MLTDSTIPAARTRSALYLLPVLILCGALDACGLGYLTQAANGQLQVMRARQPIDRVIADPATDPTVRARLSLVREARDFASRELGLPDNPSYRSFSALDRPYAVWNVVATPEFSVAPRRWCFPVAGCVSYRGYFMEQQARGFAARLAARGDDVFVAGVTAYSTLGHFSDPVVSPMLRYDDLELVSTIFHELAHQLLYVPGDSDFSEAFATTVADEGLRRWLRSHGRTGELEQYQSEERAMQVIVAAFSDGRSELATLFRQQLPPERMRARKRELLAAISQRVRELEQSYGLRTGYDSWLDAGLNNAHLASVGTYYDCVPALQRLLDSAHGQLPRFYAAMIRLRRAPQVRQALCRANPVSSSRGATKVAARGQAIPAAAR